MHIYQFNNIIYNIILITFNKPIINSVYNRNTGLLSQGFSLCKSIVCNIYFTVILKTTVSKIAYSKPNTSCTEGPLVAVVLYA